MPKDQDFTKRDNPFTLFSEWLEEATQSEINDPNAMALATSDDEGMPNVRMVLLKGLDEKGFVFYTNSESQKGNELEANAKAALAFHWKSLRRQVRVRGVVEMVTSAEADSYFKSRPHLSQIGAWASKQSRPLEGRFALKQSVALYTAQYLPTLVPRPPHWNGYRIIPTYIEFWHDRPFRLHDRVVFKRKASSNIWETKQRLYP